jgi:type IV secretory pathway TrbF-like protein
MFQFLKGTAFGLGTLLGATIVMSIIVFILSQVEFVPIIGEWVAEILNEIQQLAPADQ